MATQTPKNPKHASKLSPNKKKKLQSPADVRQFFQEQIDQQLKRHHHEALHHPRGSPARKKYLAADDAAAAASPSRESVASSSSTTFETARQHDDDEEQEDYEELESPLQDPQEKVYIYHEHDDNLQLNSTTAYVSALPPLPDQLEQEEEEIPVRGSSLVVGNYISRLRSEDEQEEVRGVTSRKNLITENELLLERSDQMPEEALSGELQDYVKQAALLYQDSVRDVAAFERASKQHSKHEEEEEDDDDDDDGDNDDSIASLREELRLADQSFESGVQSDGTDSEMSSSHCSHDIQSITSGETTLPAQNKTMSSTRSEDSSLQLEDGTMASSLKNSAIRELFRSHEQKTSDHNLNIASPASPTETQRNLRTTGYQSPKPLLSAKSQAQFDELNLTPEKAIKIERPYRSPKPLLSKESQERFDQQHLTPQKAIKLDRSYQSPRPLVSEESQSKLNQSPLNLYENVKVEQPYRSPRPLLSEESQKRFNQMDLSPEEAVKLELPYRPPPPLLSKKSQERFQERNKQLKTYDNDNLYSNIKVEKPFQPPPPLLSDDSLQRWEHSGKAEDLERSISLEIPYKAPPPLLSDESRRRWEDSGETWDLERSIRIEKPYRAPPPLVSEESRKRLEDSGGVNLEHSICLEKPYKAPPPLLTEESQKRLEDSGGVDFESSIRLEKPGKAPSPLMTEQSKHRLEDSGGIDLEHSVRIEKPYQAPKPLLSQQSQSRFEQGQQSTEPSDTIKVERPYQPPNPLLSTESQARLEREPPTENSITLEQPYRPPRQLLSAEAQARLSEENADSSLTGSRVTLDSSAELGGEKPSKETPVPPPPTPPVVSDSEGMHQISESKGFLMVPKAKDEEAYDYESDIGMSSLDVSKIQPQQNEQPMLPTRDSYLSNLNSIPRGQPDPPASAPPFSEALRMPPLSPGKGLIASISPSQNTWLRQGLSSSSKRTKKAPTLSQRDKSPSFLASLLDSISNHSGTGGTFYCVDCARNLALCDCEQQIEDDTIRLQRISSVYTIDIGTILSDPSEKFLLVRAHQNSTDNNYNTKGDNEKEVHEENVTDSLKPTKSASTGSKPEETETIEVLKIGKKFRADLNLTNAEPYERRHGKHWRPRPFLKLKQKFQAFQRNAKQAKQQAKRSHEQHLHGHPTLGIHIPAEARMKRAHASQRRH